MPDDKYDDGYATCHSTYATLLIYPKVTDPAEITARFGIEPSEWQRRGQFMLRIGRRRAVPVSGWFLSTEGHVESRDSRRHVDWLLDRIEPRADVIRLLQDEGGRTEVTCFWSSASGHGGPMIPHAQMRRLAALRLDLWFDFYGPYDT